MEAGEQRAEQARVDQVEREIKRRKMKTSSNTNCGPCKIFRGRHTLVGLTSLTRVKMNRNACISGLPPS